MDIRFCPTCGEDLRAIGSAEPEVAVVEEPQTVVRPELIRRDVLRQEVEALWGMIPIPSGMKPLGVLTFDGGKTATTVVCEDQQGRLWDCLAGETKLLDAAFGSTQPKTMQTSTSSAQMLNHSCSVRVEEKEIEGSRRYGSGI